MAKILHFVYQMNLGGAETLIMNIYRHIDRSKVQFDFAVLTNQPSHFDQEIVALGGRILPLPKPSAISFHTYSRALTNMLREYGPFAGVHSHMYDFSGYILRVADREGVPLRVSHSHTTQDGQRDSWLRNAYRWYMRRLICQHATHMFGCSHAACEALFGLNYWRDPRIRVFPNAIDLAPYEVLPSEKCTLRQSLSLPADALLIGHVGRFHPQKNHRFLIEVFATLLQELPTAHLVLVGDGSLRPEIESLIQTKGIKDSVHLLGIRSDVPQIVDTLDMFVFPSLYEGLPIALVEAQAAGVPCVVADTVSNKADIKIGLVHFVNLQARVDLWVQKILDELRTGRPYWVDRQRALQAAGYDIRHISLWLQEIYASKS